ncbi:Uncharacterized protein Adt_39564 [Abeliophyllum distichum]|uniref:Uncharacterized protein n=1 Tax=Abeliophyllum distichum TaxID=126358 RepID=A0ABD1Q754_9LAMI
MCVIIWNVRGVGSTATRRRLKKLVRIHQGLENESGKIWCFWNLGTTVASCVDHPQFLHIRVEDPRLSRPMYITPVYSFLFVGGAQGFMDGTPPDFSCSGWAVDGWGRL